MRMTRISAYVLYFQIYFHDKKHLGATDTFVKIDEGNERGAAPQSNTPCLSRLNPQHLAAFLVYPVNNTKTHRMGQ